MQSPWSPEFDALGIPFVFSGCNWVLIVVGSFFGGSFSVAG